ncbi:Dihydropteroate synthase-like protein [Gilbertella persicaria]|uniref:Folic acid synthesis protein FOL1 n=1 Tax=Rhizopus stolonifer TaxID=4846 RepID=A0A367KW89_RHIST|nr:Dihydropteroate synthase-like protein [Gilbertella persicaria]KAI8084024.1 Dihydropteroate synthase-like protein [Gilbertella persicaria]RCI06461.1 trifunctional dihydropteroate synthetase [Rhizopus stolonifer]
MEEKQYDKILIKNLVLKNVAGVEAWQRLKSQPVAITVELHTDITAAGNTDHVTNTIHYGHVTKAITKLGETSTFSSLEALAHAVVKLGCVQFGAARTQVTVEQPKALLHAAASGVKLTRAIEDYQNLDKDVVETTGEVSGLGVKDEIFVRDLRLHTIVGVNPWEREEKQVVIINLKVYPSSLPYGDIFAEQNKSHNLRTIVRTLTRHIEASGYKTIEAFGVTVARLALEKCHVNKVSVRVEKPSAILFADCSGLEVTRDRIWLKQTIEEEKKAGQKFIHYDSMLHYSKEVPANYNQTAYIAFGSNIGDRVDNINKALALLESECSSAVLDTSFLYETPPMYYTEQPAFLNGVCKIATCLDPHVLLKKLKDTENTLGRLPSFRNGPRPIDLDILFYNDLVLDDGEVLTIPHKSIQEREFVLWPLNDIARDMEHPRLFKTNGQLLSQLLKVTAESKEGPLKIDKVSPIQQNKLWRWNEKTYIMGILNTTPDSFSDGGKHNDLESAVAAAWKMKEEGADIIDVGGMSTRPGADDTFPEDEEIRRVVPVIKQLRASGFDLPISIDTFRASVAEAAVKAGADLINDISGGSRDPNMLKVMADCNVPVCLMHMRGDAQTMMSTENTTYENDDVVDDVTHVLHLLVERAIAAGVHRWNIIVDPGVGFAKTAEQDFELLRHLGDMSEGQDSLLRGFPSLVGISRKKFIGGVTGVKEAEKRTFGTAGAAAACVAGKANILRVHDVRPMWEVVQVCDQVWRKKV